MSRIAIVAVSVIAVLLFAGCGGSDDKKDEKKPAAQAATQAEAPAEESVEAEAPADGGDPESQDAEAKANARNLVSEVETCFLDQQDYTACQEPEASELPLGTDVGQVEVSEADVAEYTVAAHSESGNEFTITKGPDGTVERACDASAGSEEGGCADGTW